jgi:hypothetical protein
MPLGLKSSREETEVSTTRRSIMAQPIYKLFLAKPTEAWYRYQLSQDEQNQLFAKLDEAFKKAGGKRIVL